MTKKNIMREFKMEEISVVDRPAQKGATMTIMKRDETVEIKKEENDMTKTVEDIQKNLDSVTTALETATAALAKAEVIASLSDAEKEYMKSFGDKEKEDFLALKPEDRKKKVAETKKNDETVEISGQTISKRDVGDSVFTIMKAQAADIAESKTRIEKAEKAAEFSKFEKRASVELKHLPGTDVEKAEVLQAVSGLGEAVVKRFDAILKAADEAIKSSFETVGVKKGIEAGSNEDKLNKAAADFRKNDPKLTEAQALVKAYEVHPDLVEV